MAVSKRLRYEIFRRDNYACRYCGAASPDVKLTIDHVMPEALGGTSEPDNLVTACEPCNSGKSASVPDAPVVDDVAQDAIRWASAMKKAATIQADSLAQMETRSAAFYAAWVDWGTGLASALPSDWQRTVEIWHRASVSHEEMNYAIRAAMTKLGLPQRDLWKYTCGVVWRKLEERQHIARQLLNQETTMLQEAPQPSPPTTVIPEWMTAEVERHMALVGDHPFLDALEEDAWEIVKEVSQRFPEMDLVEVWYGYPTFKKHFGEGIKHRLLAYTAGHDFSDADESLCYQTLIENLRYAWTRVGA